jgi:hypothetical protein
MAMKKSNKALLMSAFLFPGTGHIVLKRYVSSIILIGIALLSTVTIIRFVVKQVQLVLNKVLQGEVEPSVHVIRQLVTEQQAASGSLGVDIATYSLVAVWLVSIIDCYRIIKANKNIEQIES